MNPLKRLQAGDPGSIAVVAAHPDDEVIGVGAQLSKWPNVTLIHVTDGAPHDLRDVLAAGFSQRTDYAKARRNELRAALKILQTAHLPKARWPDEFTACRTFELDCVDQETTFHLVQIACALHEILAELLPNLIVTHPYEGGHPDHDSTAFAVRAACQLLHREQLPVPEIVEMTSYHAQNSQFVSGKFLAASGQKVLELKLSHAERVLKQQSFRCFATQRRVLEQFEIDHESFRIAPKYDFTQPPHEGPLYYEQFDWKMTGGRWRYLAREANAALEFSQPLRKRHSETLNHILSDAS